MHKLFTTGQLQLNQSDGRYAAVSRQLLTPPPMSSKFVSKFAIPSADGQYMDHKPSEQPTCIM